MHPRAQRVEPPQAPGQRVGGRARDVLAGKNPAIQLNIDATRMSQAFTGGGYIQQIVSSEVSEYVAGYRAETALPVDLALRARYNPSLDPKWFGAISAVIRSITMLSLVLTGMFIYHRVRKRTQTPDLP